MGEVNAHSDASCELFSKCQELNPKLKLNKLTDKKFACYGFYHQGLDISQYKSFLESKKILDGVGYETYIPSDKELESLSFSKFVKENLYGSVDCHIGWYTGRANKLNALEFHKCNEILFLTEAAVLLLGKVGDIENNTYDTVKLEAFFVPKDSVVELYSSTLHWAPLAVTSNGIRQAVVQQRGTNTPFNELAPRPKNVTLLDELLLERNKWVLVHEEATSLVSLGAYVGLKGENLSLMSV